ncbi:MAG: hypothetical protein ABI891_06630, partial [Acidobacteriota bacterium]
MKKVFFINFVLLIFGLSVFAQTTKSDLKQLQKEIGSPVSITRNDVSIPASKTIKIYLAIKHNKSSAKDFANWVAEWNQENAAKYGELQIVDKLEDADIAAIQFQYGATRVVREEAIKLKVGTVQRDNNINKEDKFVLNSIGNSNVRAESSAVNLKLPLYSYLIVRDQNSSWAVDYSRVDERL